MTGPVPHPEDFVGLEPKNLGGNPNVVTVPDEERKRAGVMYRDTEDYILRLRGEATVRSAREGRKVTRAELVRLAVRALLDG